MGSTIPRQVIMHYIRKLVEHERVRSLVRSIPPGFLLKSPPEFLPWFSSLVDCHLEVNMNLHYGPNVLLHCQKGARVALQNRMSERAWKILRP